MVGTAIIPALVLAAGTHNGDDWRVLDISTAAELQRAFAEPVDRLEVRLAPGEYRLEPTPYTDPTCGNCPDPEHSAETTVGLHIRGGKVRLLGPAADRNGNDDDESPQEAVIVTNAGYGLLIEDCPAARIAGLTITGGARSVDGNATDGAVVVRRSRAVIENTIIRDNLGDPEIVRQTVSGVMGIVGREESDIVARHNRIIRNSWDGIALYREARAEITGNVIDGVDKATGATYTGGRGVGIGITWNAQADVKSNLVTRYWKGIGIFVNARAVIEENIVEDIVTWGIALWGPGESEPVAHIRRNVVYRTGACGVSITASTEADDPGELTGNIIVEAAQDERYDAPDRYCYQCALAIHRRPEGFKITDNVFFNNRRADDGLPDHDVSEGEFIRAAGPMIEGMRDMPALEDARFMEWFRRGGE